VPLVAGEREPARDYKYIHPGGIQSCQLVMGFTELAEATCGIPFRAHHRGARRFTCIRPRRKVMVLLMASRSRRGICFAQREVALSPNCPSIAAAARAITSSSGHGRGNQVFDDMDGVKPVDLR